MTPQEKIYSIVSKCNSAGFSLSLVDGRILVEPSPVPSHILAELRSNKEAILAYLGTVAALPVPEFIPFVAKNLDVIEWPNSVATPLSAFWLGSRPYWRLTPSVALWFTDTVASQETACRKSGKALDWLAEAVSLVGWFGDWVSRHCPPHAIYAAFRSPTRGTLPKTEDVPFTVPDWSQGTYAKLNTKRGENGELPESKNNPCDSRSARTVHAP